MTTAFQVVDTLLKVALLPSHTEFPIDAAKEQLNEMLFKYNDDIMGVPIVYYDINFPPNKQCGRILNELPWVHVDMLAKMLIFKPVPGNSIVGQISKVWALNYINIYIILGQVSDNHISLLVCGMFNASILEAELSAKYSYTESTNSWYVKKIFSRIFIC